MSPIKMLIFLFFIFVISWRRFCPNPRRAQHKQRWFSSGAQGAHITTLALSLAGGTWRCSIMITQTSGTVSPAVRTSPAPTATSPPSSTPLHFITCECRPGRDTTNPACPAKSRWILCKQVRKLFSELFIAQQMPLWADRRLERGFHKNIVKRIEIFLRAWDSE